MKLRSFMTPLVDKEYQRLLSGGDKNCKVKVIHLSIGKYFDQLYEFISKQNILLYFKVNFNVYGVFNFLL